MRRRDLELEGVEPPGVVHRLALEVDERRALRARRDRQEPLEDAGEGRASPGRAAARARGGSAGACGGLIDRRRPGPRSAAASGATELRSLRPARSRFSAARARSLTMSSRSLATRASPSSTSAGVRSSSRMTCTPKGDSTSGLSAPRAGSAAAARAKSGSRRSSPATRRRPAAVTGGQRLGRTSRPSAGTAATAGGRRPRADRDRPWARCAAPGGGAPSGSGQRRRALGDGQRRRADGLGDGAGARPSWRRRPGARSGPPRAPCGSPPGDRPRASAGPSRRRARPRWAASRARRRGCAGGPAGPARRPRRAWRPRDSESPRASAPRARSASRTAMSRALGGVHPLRRGRCGPPRRR